MQNNVLLIDKIDFGTRLALLKYDSFFDSNKDYIKFYFDGFLPYPKINNIYLGRIISNSKKKKYAFIDIGLSQLAILNIRNNQNFLNGEYLVVQIERENLDSSLEKLANKKGVRVTTNIMLDNSMKKTENFNILEKKIILKSNNLIDFLEIIKETNKIGLYLESQTELESIIMNNPKLEIFISDWSISKMICMLLNKDQKLKFLLNPFTVYGIEDIWQSLFESIIYIKSGGYLIFEKTSGFNIIDINTQYNDPNDSNIDSIDYIIRQLNWRNISGNLLIDFVGTSYFNKKKIVKKMKDILPSSWNILGWSPLGPLQLRKQIKECSLTEKVNFFLKLFEYYKFYN